MACNTVNISCWWTYYIWTNKKREAAFVASGMSFEERDHLNKLAGETDVTDLRAWNPAIGSLADFGAENPHFRYVC